MNKLKSIAIAIAAVAGMGIAGQASAANLSCSNLTFSGADYQACQGFFAGNDKPEVVENLQWSLDIGDVVSKDADNTAATTSEIINGVAGKSGTGSVTFLQAISDPFVLTLKLGNNWAAYLFNTDVAANTTWTFSGGPSRAGGLSHITYWGSEPVPAVPEPETYALMLAGLGMVGMMSRRRRRQA